MAKHVRSLLAMSALALAVSGTGCRSRRMGANDTGDGGVAVDARVNGGGDGGSEEDGGIETPVRNTTTKLDILFVIDNSGSMEVEQRALLSAFPDFVRALTTGDVDGRSETPEEMADQFPPFADLHVAIVTSDMGTAGVSINTCALQPFGEDGAARRTPGIDAAGACSPTVPVPISLNDLSSSAIEAFEWQVQCAGLVGTNGCGFEQQLEAMLKAITPSTSSTRFSMSSTGNADTDNAGFLRTDSTLLVVVLTDEEDCSFANTSIIDGSDSDVMSTNINLRCIQYPELLHPAARYVDGLRNARPGNDPVYFALIAGVPEDLIGGVSADDSFDYILSDPRMHQQADPSNPNVIRPSCNDSLRGKADPPRRLVEVAREMGGDHATVQSICQDDLTQAMRNIVDMIAYGRAL